MEPDSVVFSALGSVNFSFKCPYNIILLETCVWIYSGSSLNCFFITVTKSQDSEQLAQTRDQYQVEEQKNSQIVDDVLKHYDDWTESWENSQKEESFDDQEKHYDPHQKLTNNWRVPHNELQDNVQARNSDVANILIVIRVPEVNFLPLFVKWYYLVA